MDTFEQSLLNPGHVYTKKQLMELLEKVFSNSGRKPGSSFLEELPAIGSVKVDLQSESKTNDWSEGIYELLEVSPKEIEANHETFLSFVVEEDRKELKARMMEYFDGIGNDEHLIYRIVGKNGRMSTLLGVPKIIRDTSGNPLLLHVTLLDASELIKKHGTLQEVKHKYTVNLSSTWLNHIFENKVAGIFILDETGRFLRANQTYRKLTGYSHNELKELTFLDVTPESGWGHCREKMEKLLSGELESFTFEKQLLTKSQELRWIEVSCTTVKQDKNYILCFATDVHEKKLISDKLRRSEEQLRQAQEVARIGSWRIDLNTLAITWSRGMYDIMELPYDYQPTVDSVPNLIHPEDRDLFVEKMSSKEEVKDLEIRHITASDVKHFLINSRLEYENGIPVRYHGTSQDISERKLHDKRLQLVQETAKLGWWEAHLVTDEDDIWSDAVYELLELDRETTRPCFESFCTTLHPDDLPVVTAQMQDPEFLKNGWNNKETRHKTADGTYKYLISSAHVIWDGDRPVKMIGTMMDITTTKEAQLRLEEAQKIARMGWWEADVNGKITWSETYYEIMGVDKSEKPPSFEDYVKFVHPEDRPWVLRDPKTFGDGWDNKEMRYMRKSGGYIHVLSSGRIIYKDGVPVKMMGTNMDITELKETQLKLEQAQRIAKLGWWEASLVTDEDHIWSDSLFELLELDKATTRPCFESFIGSLHPDDRQAAIASMQNPENLKNGWHNREARVKTANGGYKYFTVNAHVIWDGDRPVKLIGTMMDITTTKEVQLRLEETQKLARLGWWEANSWKDITWSDTIYEIMEMDKSKGALSFEGYIKRVHPEDRPWILRDTNTIGDGWDNKEIRYIRKSGGYTHVLSSGRVIYNGDVPVKVIGTNMDITELKETQLKLEQAQRIAKLGWWEFDLTGAGNHWYSPEYMKIFGISSVDELSSLDDYLTLLHPEDMPKFMEIYQNSLKKEGWSNLVIRIKRKNGGYRYITSNATIECVDDEPVRVFGSVYDITDFKEIELELAKNLVNLEAMVTSMENIVFVIDDRYRFREVFCNDSQKLHIMAQDFIGKKVKDIWKEGDIHGGVTLRHCREALEKGITDPVVYKYAPRNHAYWWEASFRPFVGQNGRQWLTVIINDITSRKTAEEELIRSVQKEKELSEMRAQFVSMASHQFRTPLTVIKSNMQLLELSQVKDPVIDKVTRRLQSEVDRLVNLMEDIMAMGKVQSSSVKPNFRPVNVHALVKQLKLHAENQQKDGRSLIVTVCGEERPVNLDSQFMEHALNNLIENAFKYSADAPDPEVKLNYEANKLCISVIDYGIGIPEEDRGRLFTSFQRCSNSQHIQGTGLGLAVAKEFVRLNGGTIYLSTNRESGTEFCINFPIKSVNK